MTVNIGKGIKFVRTAAGERQGAMAQALGISQNYLSLLENNRAEPSVALIRKVSKVYGVPASFLLWEESHEQSADPAVSERVSRIESLIHELQQLRLRRYAERPGH